MSDKSDSSKPYWVITFFFLVLFLYSRFGPSLPINLGLQLRGEPLVVSGEGSITVPNETAKIMVGITETGNSLADVQESVNQKTKTLTDSLKKLGVEEKDIKTVNYDIQPQQDYNQTPARITGYIVSTNYEVKINDLDKVNEAITIVTSMGANSLGGISFDVNEETRKEKLNEARAEAVREARDKAEGLASAAGINLGRVINVTESEGFGRPIPFAAVESKIGADNLITQPEVEPGTNEITVTVNLTFEVR